MASSAAAAPETSWWLSPQRQPREQPTTLFVGAAPGASRRLVRRGGPGGVPQPRPRRRPQEPSHGLVRSGSPRGRPARQHPQPRPQRPPISALFITLTLHWKRVCCLVPQASPSRNGKGEGDHFEGADRGSASPHLTAIVFVF